MGLDPEASRLAGSRVQRTTWPCNSGTHRTQHMGLQWAFPLEAYAAACAEVLAVRNGAAGAVRTGRYTAACSPDVDLDRLVFRASLSQLMPPGTRTRVNLRRSQLFPR